MVRFMEDALRFYFEFHSKYDGFYGAFIHDPLVAAAALDPTLARTEALTVEIELEGRWTTGETVTDWRRAWGREPNLDIAIEVDIEAFFERFIERVGFYDPKAPEGREGLRVDMERLDYWRGKGAKLSDTAARLVKQFGSKAA